MGKSDQKIIVVPKNVLFADGEFEGFQRHEVFDYEKVLLENFLVMRRGSLDEDPNHPDGNAERNYNFKQPIGYMIFVNPFEKKVFAYKRAEKDRHYGEKRLQGNWSWGVGGHVEPLDFTKGENPFVESRLRELEEEVEIVGKILETRVLGYINDNSNDVGKVHLGLLYLVEIDGVVRKKDDEIEIGEMYSLSELEDLMKTTGVIVENWSKIAFGPLRDYFGMWDN